MSDNQEYKNNETVPTRSHTWRQVWADMRVALGVSSVTDDNKSPLSSDMSSDDSQIRTESTNQINSIQTPNEPSNIATPDVSVDVSDTEDAPFSQQRPFWKRKIVIGAFVLILAIAVFFKDILFAPYPPAPNVLVTWSGGQITIEDVEEHLKTLVSDESAQERLRTPNGYASILEDMVSDTLVQQGQATQQPDQGDGFSHTMQHIAEEINLDELHTQMHEGQLGVSEGDIQAYYEANKETFGDRTLTDVRKEIEDTLKNANEDTFVADYIASLKQRASITRDMGILAAPQPTEDSLLAYYTENAQSFNIPEQIEVNEIHIPLGSNKEQARERALALITAIRSGAGFPPMTEQMDGLTSEPHTIARGSSQDTTYESTLFSLEVGRISDVLETSDGFTIAQVTKKNPPRQRAFDEVWTEIFDQVYRTTEEKYYADNADRVLVTLNGKQLTLGDFWSEYQELPSSFLATYTGIEGKQNLVERIIERMLIYEDSITKVSQTKSQEKIDEMKLKVLAQMLEQEEVDEKITVDDAELRAFYDERKDQLMLPPKSRVRQIAIRSGESEEEHTQAMNKAEEAYKKLVPGAFGEASDFATVVNEYSEDEETKTNGGEVNGWVSESNELLGEFSEHGYHAEVLATAVGEISRPFEANGYLYIVEVLERTNPELIAFEQAKEFIREAIMAQKHEDLALGLSAKLKDEYDVTIYSRTLRKLLQENNFSE